MLFRSFLIGVLVTGAALGWIMAAGPSFTLGLVKDDLVNAYEKAGVDVSDCKKSQRTLIDPGGGMPECLEGSFRDIQRQLEGADGAEEQPSLVFRWRVGRLSFGAARCLNEVI